MNNKLIAAFIIVFLLLGFVIGVLINDIPFLSVSREVQLGAIIGSSITAFTTLVLAFSIPYLITKQLEDKKGIKQFLISEITLFTKELEKIKLKLEDCYKSGAIKNEDKMEINLLFEYLDKKVDSISEQLRFSYCDKSKDDIQELKDVNANFWKKITSGEFMSAKFVKITPEFWKSSFGSYCDCEMKVKMLAHKISKY
ncbi:MAG TPA: hypothetical protein PKE69_00960 [Pyrinomonadaceae bacterium]|mgnify:CR=1 FL=1|nr:hypothetical protein [Pyrinomonadaceae bacterium]